MIGERRPGESCYFLNGHRTSCRSLIRDFSSVFSPDGRYLIVGSMRTDIELWNVETRQLEGHAGNWVEGVAISPDGAYIATYESESASVYVWNMESRQLLWNAKSGNGRISDIAFSPDNQHLYVATNRAEVRVWDVISGQQIDMFNTEFKQLQTINISPDGKKVLLLSVDGEILWDIKNKRIHKMWTDFAAGWYYNGVELSPDGKTVLTVSPNFIKSWDVPSDQMRLLVSDKDYAFNVIAISSDSQKFAVGKEPLVEVRDIQTGKVVTQFPHRFLLPEKMTFSSSGKWLAVKGHWGHIDILNIEFPEKNNDSNHHLNLKYPAAIR